MSNDGRRSIEVSRLVHAPAAAIFGFLTQPANHVVLDTSGMVRAAATGALITHVGQVFVMDMHNDIKGTHQVENHVVSCEPERAVGWAPAEPGQPPAGHTWTWRLNPDGPARTQVSLIYDWTRFSHLDMIDHLPVVDQPGLLASIDRLARALGASIE